MTSVSAGIDPHRRFLYAATRLMNGNFTEDALLDVDGTIAGGHAEVSLLYGRPPRGDSLEEPR